MRTRFSLTAMNSATPLALVSSKIMIGVISPAYSKPVYSASSFLYVPAAAALRLRK